MQFPIKPEDVAAFKRNGFTVTKTVVYYAQRISGDSSHQGRVGAKVRRRGDAVQKDMGVLLTTKHAKFQVPNSLTAKVFVAAKTAIQAQKANKNKKGPILRPALVTEIARRTGLKKQQVGPALSVLVLKQGFLKYAKAA